MNYHFLKLQISVAYRAGPMSQPERCEDDENNSNGSDYGSA
jgi:hypothetical protein